MADPDSAAPETHSRAFAQPQTVSSGSVRKNRSPWFTDQHSAPWASQTAQIGKIPWRRAWQAIPLFLPGESHGQRSLAQTVVCP